MRGCDAELQCRCGREAFQLDRITSVQLVAGRRIVPVNGQSMEAMMCQQAHSASCVGIAALNRERRGATKKRLEAIARLTYPRL
jgi:hypothetical protein